MSYCRHPLTFDALVEYWLGETDDTTTLAVDEHLLGCDVCGAQLDEVIALARGVRGAFDAGLVGAFVAAPFVERLAAGGAHVREYHLPHDGSVNCTVAPDDDVLVARFDAPLAGVTRVDAVARSSLAEDELRLDDIPFDAAGGQVTLIAKVSEVRRAPAHSFQIRLVAMDAGAERVLGRYTLNHSPWVS